MTTRPPPLYGRAGKCGLNMGATGEPGEHAASACDKPVQVIVEFGCVHEHVFREGKCASHGYLLASGDAPMVCSACWQGWGGVTPHTCRLLGRVVADLEATRQSRA